MDGTILCEKPDYIEVALTKRRLLEKAKSNPQLESIAIYRAVLDGDADYLYKNIASPLLIDLMQHFFGLGFFNI